MAYWPTQLPKPKLDGYSLAPQAAFARTDMDAGPARQRRRFTQAPTEITLELVLTDAQMAIFEFWYEIEIHSGAAWFNAPMKNGMGVTTVEARFVEPWQSQPLGAAMNRVQCRWETRNRPVMSIGEYLSLLDIPALEFDFAGTGSILQTRTSELQPVASIEFTRNSSATYFGSDGLLKTAAANEPRIDYDPATGECKGLLIEESRTNLLTYSEQLDKEIWGKSQATVTQNAATAPDGTLTADKFLENNANDAHLLWQSGVSFTAGTTYTASFFAKAAERSSIRALAGSAAFGFSKTIDFDLLAGTTSDPTSSSITPVGNGWHWCRITDAPTVTGVASAIPMTLRNAGVSVYQGDGTSGVYIWGAQLEVGSFPTSYIKTEATAATRASDSAVMTGANFSSWYRQDEGTISIDHAVAFDSNTFIFPLLFSVDDGTASNRMSVIRRTSDDKAAVSLISLGVSQTGISSFGAALYGASQSVAFAYNTNDIALSLNATTPALDNEVAIPVVSRAVIGGTALYFESLNGHIGRISYYPKRLADTKLQALTK